MKGRMIGLAVFAVACALSSGIATSDEDAGAAPDITLDRVLREHPDLRGAYETLRATPSAATANTDPFEVAMARLLEISGERREEAAVLVATFLDNENWGIRQDAVGALGGLRVASYIPEVVKRLDDTELGVRLAAIGACAELGAKSAIPRIARFLAEEPGESIYACPRFYAAAAL
ncbi:MAG: HEAT repeat domain-containing protein, partial [Planctomycetes bacterium]|nr:HEAT repeat domain-containing protein [Planctomycetota bacterium]